MWAFVFFALWALSPTPRVYVINANNASQVEYLLRDPWQHQQDLSKKLLDIINEVRRLQAELRTRAREATLNKRAAHSSRNESNVICDDVEL